MRRPTLVALVSAAGIAVALRSLPRPDDLDSAIAAIAAVLASVLLAWCGLVAVLARLDVGAVQRLAPRWMLSLVLGGAGGALLIAPAASGHPLDGLRLPDRPAPTLIRHEVQPGDTLWAIAQRHAPGDATLEEIALATAAWHERNRSVIGADPHRILPGQLLIAPEGAGR